MKNIKKIIAFSAISVAMSCGKTSEEKQNNTTEVTEKEPLNIIFMVGDGMGIPQVSSAFYFGENTPNFKQFESIGLSRTSSTSHLITDSAAGATAFSSC